MKTRILIGTGVLAAFLGGALVGGFTKPAMSEAFSGDAQAVVERRVAPRRAYAEPAYYRSEPRYSEPVVYREAPRQRRSTERQVLIVAGSSGAGAAIGALAGGKKGAGIGAIAGAVGGLIYNEHTKEKRPR